MEDIEGRKATINILTLLTTNLDEQGVRPRTSWAEVRQQLLAELECPNFTPDPKGTPVIVLNAQHPGSKNVLNGMGLQYPEVGELLHRVKLNSTYSHYSNKSPCSFLARIFQENKPKEVFRLKEQKERAYFVSLAKRFPGVIHVGGDTFMIKYEVVWEGFDG